MSDVNLAVYLVMLHTQQPHMSFDQAMKLARKMMEHHKTVERVSEDKGYNQGHKDGYELGKRDAEVPSNYELDKLRRVYDFQKEKAQEVVKDATQKHGTKKKIQVIKEVRNATGLGLKDSKDIVDKYISDLTSGLAEWERELLEAPFGVHYSDEPPF